ncbi:O-antigen polysaccharide polymerase Wzy [Candidatus Uabimicrobium amorphum]|uniref:Oligosaccharide repeat unit polymerase n=1 Tax=Uabimicrobium amorphum TaxID=2596890 RepID=A0A5S9IHQ2_UABAM|nr:O-antigen polysaccharide polymerase Wzy [Candidatus Uabimicrobium amorphum]BBM81686.1 hypothetical protein UABAM_00025 [Candidatus Uabimicrobium amorphum]
MKKYILLASIFILAAFVSISTLDWYTNLFDISLYSISYILTLVFVFFGIYNLVVLKLHVLSIPQLYLIVTFCFTSGSVFVYGLGYESAFDRLKWFDENYMILATKSILLAVLSFEWGISCALLGKKTENGYFEKREFKDVSPILIVGATLFFLSAVYTMYSYKIVFAAITSSYKDRHIMLIESDFRYFVVLSYCILPLSNMMIYSAWHKKNLILPHIAALFSFFVFLVSGGRGPTLSFLLAALFCLRVTGKYEFKHSKIFLLGLVIVFFIPFVKQVRDQSATDVYGHAPTVLQGFMEMGQSIQTLSGTMMIIPNMENFQYGKRYVSAVLRVLPNITKQNITERNANLGSWLTLYLNPHAFGKTGGLGYLQISEFYSQFGIWGILIGFFFLGYITTVWNRKCEGNIYTERGVAMSSFIVFILLLWIRAEAALLRYIIWAAIIIFSSNQIIFFVRKK